MILKMETGLPAGTTLAPHFTRENQTRLTNLAKAAVFTSLAVGAGYALLLVPNVELITAIVFTSGVYLGPRWGMVVGATGEFIFSAANPMGSGLVFPPLIISQMLGMAIAGLSGGILRNFFINSVWTVGRKILLGCIGGLITFIFDSLTTISYPIAAGYEPKQTVAIYLTGIGFMVLHQLSNTVIFATALPRVFSRMNG